MKTTKKGTQTSPCILAERFIGEWQLKKKKGEGGGGKSEEGASELDYSNNSSTNGNGRLAKSSGWGEKISALHAEAAENEEISSNKASVS